MKITEAALINIPDAYKSQFTWIFIQLHLFTLQNINALQYTFQSFNVHTNKQGVNNAEYALVQTLIFLFLLNFCLLQTSFFRRETVLKHILSTFGVFFLYYQRSLSCILLMSTFFCPVNSFIYNCLFYYFSYLCTFFIMRFLFYLLTCCFYFLCLMFLICTIL